MSKDIKGDHKHLTLSDRIFIEQALVRGDNFRTIAKALGKDPSTISLEIRSFLEWDNGHYTVEYISKFVKYLAESVLNVCDIMIPHQRRRVIGRKT